MFSGESARSTTYTVQYFKTGAGQASYSWSGPDCGDQRTQEGVLNEHSSALTFTWRHAHPPCDPTTEHARVTITLVINDGEATVTCTFKGASTGTGPDCTRKRK